MNIRIPVYQPRLDGNEKKYVLECIETSWISSRGKYVEIFEKEFAKRISVPYSASCSNGTVALHLAMLALGISEGDEVIVPTLTYIASANAVTYTGATPVFCDSDAKTWQLDVNDVKRKITEKTRAILAVHLYGQACNMEELRELANRNDLFLIEDCAEAIGTKFKDLHVGSFGDISTFSFFGNKTMTTGEGGMVCTNDKTLDTRVKRFKGQGLAEHREYWHDLVGYNYRMTNIQAAIGLAQLERLDETLRLKKELAKEYSNKLAGLPIQFQAETELSNHSHWMVSILVENASLRDTLREHMSKDGIETRPLFYPIHTMPMYSKSYKRLPVAEDLSWRGVNLPSWPALSSREIDYICKSVRTFFND